MSRRRSATVPPAAARKSRNIPLKLMAGASCTVVELPQLDFQQAQNRVLHMIATGEPLHKTLNVLAEEIASLSSNGAFCSILLLEETGKTLYPIAMPGFPIDYQRMVRLGLPVLPNSGTCGPAAYWKQPIGTEDVVTSPFWDDCRNLVLPYGFRAYWSTPIFDSHGQVLGTFGMTYRRPCTPDARDQQLVELSTHLASIAIERQRDAEKIQAVNAKLEQQIQQHKAQLQQAISFEATLKRITDKVRDSLDKHQILQTTVEELGQIPGVYCCDAGVYDAALRTINIIHEHKQPGIESGIGKVIRLEQFPDIYAHLLRGEYLQFCMLPAASSPSREQNKDCTVLACPIVDDAAVVGNLWLIRHREEVFDDQEVKLVQQVANQCAIALRQARLYQSSQAQVQELERVNQMKDDFLSTVSHELRTPIANMKMAIKMLSLASSDKQRERYLGILQQQCQRESDLINDLLDLQQLEAGGQPRALTDWVNLAEWLPTAVEPFVERSQERQQLLSIKMLPGLPVSLQTHRNSLERIISELLNNACKYTAKGGRIELEVSCNPDADSVRFQVRNEAAIAQSELPNLFKKFYRIPNADPWKQGGTGLGLALIQRLVEQLQGKLVVTSQDGWTNFTVELPG